MEAERIGRVLGVVYRHSLNYMNSFSQELGLSALECVFLVSILVNEGINQEQLSTLHAIDKSATAKAMKSLEAKGFITREQSRDDKRAKNVFPTQKSQQTHSVIAEKLQAYLEYTSKDIDAEDFAITLRTLERVASRLTLSPLAVIPEGKNTRGSRRNRQ